MFVCSDCKVEMRCVKTGCVTVFNELVQYSGDEYECPLCQHRIRNLAKGHEPYKSENLNDLTRPIFVYEGF